MNDRRSWTMFSLTIALLIGALRGFVARAAEPSIPAVLEPWRGWVMDNHPEQKCPPRFDNGSSPAVRVDEHAESRSGQRRRPLRRRRRRVRRCRRDVARRRRSMAEDVRVGSAPAIVTRSDDRPRCGFQRVTTASPARCAGTKRPIRSLIPAAARNAASDGRRRRRRATADQRRTPVARQRPGCRRPTCPTIRSRRACTGELDDGVPMMLDTYIDLSVAGSHRIVTLGRAMPDGFEPVAIDSATACAPRCPTAISRCRSNLASGRYS